MPCGARKAVARGETMAANRLDTCFARLAYAYYPYLNVTVDGQPFGQVAEALVTVGHLRF